MNYLGAGSLFAGRALLVSTKLPFDFRAFDRLSISTGSRAKRTNQYLPINRRNATAMAALFSGKSSMPPHATQQ
jgi:hypothetical protein